VSVDLYCWTLDMCAYPLVYLGQAACPLICLRVMLSVLLAAP